MELNKNNMLIIVIWYLIVAGISCDDSPQNNLWSIYFEIKNQNDSSTVDSAKVVVEYNNDILLNFTPEKCWHKMNGIYELTGGSRENKKSVVDQAIMNTEYHMVISKEGFYDLDTILSGQVLRDTIVSEFDVIEKRAPAIFLKEKNGD